VIFIPGNSRVVSIRKHFISWELLRFFWQYLKGCCFYKSKLNFLSFQFALVIGRTKGAVSEVKGAISCWKVSPSLLLGAGERWGIGDRKGKPK
jgi:hypothetical protein